MIQDQPDLRFINPKLTELRSDFVYEFSQFKDSSGDVIRSKIVMLTGFLTDRASVPQFLWSLGFTRDGIWNAAALVHDLLYQVQGRLSNLDSKRYTYFEWVNDSWVAMERVLTREQCDELFKFIMLDYGVDTGKAQIMFLAVRIFGQIAWNT